MFVISYEDLAAEPRKEWEDDVLGEAGFDNCL